jgi:hypothetical protein
VIAMSVVLGEFVPERFADGLIWLGDYRWTFLESIETVPKTPFLYPPLVRL